MPHGPIPLPSDNPDSPNSNGNAALKKEMKDDGESLLDGASGSQAANIVKANKGMILRKSVEYIRWVGLLPVGFSVSVLRWFALRSTFYL